MPAPRRDLYRLAVFVWMMPLVAILSTIDTVLPSAALAPATSLASINAWMDFSVLRILDRS